MDDSGLRKDIFLFQKAFRQARRLN